MKRTILFLLAVATIATPVANATGPALLSPVQRIILQEDRGGHVSVQSSAAVTPAQRIIVQEDARRNDPALLGPGPAPTVVQVVDSGGFHWEDAGIGAAVIAAVALMLVGATMVVRGRRTSHA